MIKSDDKVIITGSELDQIMLFLEASFAATGDTNIFKVIDILMSDTHKEIKELHNDSYPSNLSLLQVTG